jgi:cupin superfamily acireductone dioxygenase involved in methionine salvage
MTDPFFNPHPPSEGLIKAQVSARYAKLAQVLRKRLKAINDEIRRARKVDSATNPHRLLAYRKETDRLMNQVEQKARDLVLVGTNDYEHLETFTTEYEAFERRYLSPETLASLLSPTEDSE